MKHLAWEKLTADEIYDLNPDYWFGLISKSQQSQVIDIRNISNQIVPVSTDKGLVQLRPNVQITVKKADQGQLQGLARGGLVAYNVRNTNG